MQLKLETEIGYGNSMKQIFDPRVAAKFTAVKGVSSPQSTN
jgi:hypothetical protein